MQLVPGCVRLRFTQKEYLENLFSQPVTRKYILLAS